MDVQEKLSILSGAAKYDVSCASSGSSRSSKSGSLGSVAASGICHSFTADGRCISLLKILLTNYCIYDCAYCINRKSNDVERAAFTVDEVVDLTMNFYRRNYIEGLFLSSGVVVSPNHTMEMLTTIVDRLRNQEHFQGYIHIKAIPGADEEFIKNAGKLVDRMSINIELPSNESLKLLAPDKKKEQIISPMRLIKSSIVANKEERKLFHKAPSFVPAGQSTQLIVGATKESDFNILNLSEALYDKFSLKRVYYSAYISVNTGKNLPEPKNPPTLREHRLYQGDWLLRFYGFKANELLSKDAPNFDVNFDPKTNWAINNINVFPLEVNKAPLNMLLRVPGIGVRGASRIVSSRRINNLRFDDLKKLGIVLKRAQYFIVCNGKYFGAVPFEQNRIRNALMPAKNLLDIGQKWEQMTLFPNDRLQLQNNQLLLNDYQSGLSGEL